MKSDLGKPQQLRESHHLEAFSCGKASLDEWLKRRALPNQFSGASRTFVVADGQERVWGYYAIAAGAVSHQLATGNVRRNMPDPVPVMVLARLAVDHQAQGIRLGAALLRDAILRTLAVSRHAGVRALLVHALDEPARQFYEHHGFQVSPLNPMTLMLRMDVALLEQGQLPP